MKISPLDILPKKFKINGGRAGLYKKTDKLDLALFYSEAPCHAAALFTQNRVQAAPIIISKLHAASPNIRAIVANSGCANACTGSQGLADARELCALTAKHLGLEKEQVLVASTGVIGKFLEMGKIRPALKNLSARLLSEPANTLDAVKAIMTTDTFPKRAQRTVKIGGKKITIWGCAKGSGMIHPNMATMFSFILTDAGLPKNKLQALLKTAVDGTFNSLSVDGDTSTNDCVFLLANGAAGAVSGAAAEKTFARELNELCLDLARQMADDGEGATKRIEIFVQGARKYEDAHRVAATVATSPLVKTAFFGEDANWGRVLAAIGRSGVMVNPDKISIYFGKLCLFKNGRPVLFSEAAAKKILGQKAVDLIIQLNQGSENARYLTCDYSLDYIKINADYRS